MLHSVIAAQHSADATATLLLLHRTDALLFAATVGTAAFGHKP